MYSDLKGLTVITDVKCFKSVTHTLSLFVCGDGIRLQCLEKLDRASSAVWFQRVVV